MLVYTTQLEGLHCSEEIVVNGTPVAEATAFCHVIYHWLVFASNEYLKKQFVGNVSATLVIIELAAISIPQRDC